MRTTPTYEQIPLRTEVVRERLPITEALKLLSDLRNGPINSFLLTEIKGAETELLQMKAEGIEYVSGALLVMLNNLKNSNFLPLTSITQAFTTSANQELFDLAA